MANGDGSGGGRLSLGERVHKLERRAAENHREIKKVKSGALGTDDEELVSWIDKKVELVPADPGREAEQGILRKVRRYTLLVETDDGLEVINKGQVFKVRQVR